MDTVWADRTQPDRSHAGEAQLVRAMRDGDEPSFQQCVELHGPRMLAVARRLLANDDDAQDAVQEAFLSAFQAIERFDGRSQLATWLYRIAVNAALARLRLRRRTDERSIDDLLPRFKDDGHQAEPSSAWTEPTEAAIVRKETQAAVRQAIGQLPEIYRTVLVLRDIDGLETNETAQLLEVTAAVVKTRLHRARQALRTLLDGWFQRGAL